jgi:hypothetical protein
MATGRWFFLLQARLADKLSGGRQALFSARPLKPAGRLCETERLDFIASELCTLALRSVVFDHGGGRGKPRHLLIYLPWVWLFCAAQALADDSVIVWPPGWQVETLPDAPASQASRQRAVKADGNGDPAMVVELTRTPLAADHQVNLSGVLLQMRKVLQIDFAKGGYQSVCNTLHPGTLGNLTAMETTCKVLLNGGHVMTQTLVAATAQGSAWSLSYAGSAQGYSDNETAVKGIRDSLIFSPQP